MALTPCRLSVELTMFATPNRVVLMSTFLIAGKVKNFIYLLCIQLSSSFFFFIRCLLVPFVRFFGVVILSLAVSEKFFFIPPNGTFLAKCVARRLLRSAAFSSLSPCAV